MTSIRVGATGPDISGPPRSVAALEHEPSRVALTSPTSRSRLLTGIRPEQLGRRTLISSIDRYGRRSRVSWRLRSFQVGELSHEVASQSSNIAANIRDCGDGADREYGAGSAGCDEQERRRPARARRHGGERLGERACRARAVNAFMAASRAPPNPTLRGGKIRVFVRLSVVISPAYVLVREPGKSRYDCQAPASSPSDVSRPIPV